VDPTAGNRLFVYGSLRSGREEARLLEPFTRSRTKGARVRGELRRGGQARARARFDPGSPTVILGEIVELDPERVSDAIDTCLHHAHDGYRLTTVNVQLADGSVVAHALEWEGQLEDVGEHLAATIARIKIAHYHCHRLAQIGQDDPRERVIFQAHSDGVLSSAGSAGDELAAAFHVLLGYVLERTSPRTLFERIAQQPRSEYAGEIADFRSWWDEPLVRDAAELRELTTPHHYERSPRGPQWVFAEVAVRDNAEPYLGPRGVLGYCVKYVSTLDVLETLAGKLP
jgi:gamma-glutamylcyclotransferase (GGCT)/AIG2-like uncharacterized protein YtfP